MNDFVPNKEFLHRILLHYYHMKKSVYYTYRILFEVYGDHAPSEHLCQKWFTWFESNNFDLDEQTKVYHPSIFLKLQRPVSILVMDNWVAIPVPSPKKVFLRDVLLHYFKMKESAYSSHNTLLYIYGDQSLGIRKCYTWYKQFRSGIFDFDVEEQVGAPKKFDDEELKLLLFEDPTQTQEKLAEKLKVTQRAVSHRLKALGFIREAGKLVPSFTSSIGKI